MARRRREVSCSTSALRLDKAFHGADSSQSKASHSSRKKGQQHSTKNNCVSSRTRAKTQKGLDEHGTLRSGRRRMQTQKEVESNNSTSKVSSPYDLFWTPSSSSTEETPLIRLPTCHRFSSSSDLNSERSSSSNHQRNKRSTRKRCAKRDTATLYSINSHLTPDSIISISFEEDGEGGEDGGKDAAGDGKCDVSDCSTEDKGGGVAFEDVDGDGGGGGEGREDHGGGEGEGECGATSSSVRVYHRASSSSSSSVWPGHCESTSTPHLKIGKKRRSSGSDEDASPTKKSPPATRRLLTMQPTSESESASVQLQDRIACLNKSSPQLHSKPDLQKWLDTFKLWGNAERMMALDDLINHCAVPEVRHMMHILQPYFQRDFISLLPREIAVNVLLFRWLILTPLVLSSVVQIAYSDPLCWLQIAVHVLFFLKPKDLMRAAQTCRRWRLLCEDNLLWREKCAEEGISSALFSSARSLDHSQPGCYKALYLRQSRIEDNWRKNSLRLPMILKAHDDHVITCLEFCGQRIVSGSDDNTLKVWSAVTGKCLRTLVGHTGGVWSSQMSGNIVISGSTDRSLRVWNADTGECKHVLYGHTSTVRCMSLYGKKVVSGSRDATMRMWDIETGHCLHVLLGHVAAVRCVLYDGKRVVSGAYDYTVRVWKPETETCLHVLQGHTNRVYSLQFDVVHIFDGVHIVSGSLDTSIRVWNVNTGACLHTLVGHQSLTSGLELKDNILVSGNADSTVKVWDITTGKCLQTLQGANKHQSAVTCLQFNKKFVVTSSDDGTVKIWDLHTGEYLRDLVSLPSGGSGGVVWRLRCSNTQMVCAVGSRNGTEDTKLMVLDFDTKEKKTPEKKQEKKQSSQTMEEIDP
ncbi:hypothetical protein ACOMHN_053848 [Nucella lapillus]